MNGLFGSQPLESGWPGAGAAVAGSAPTAHATRPSIARARRTITYRGVRDLARDSFTCVTGHRRGHRTKVINWRIPAAGLLAAGLCLSVPASGAVAGNAALTLTFTTTSPGSPTGLRVDVRLGDPVGSDHKPRQLTG